MDSQYSVPTPKTPRKQLSRDDRLRIETLYFDANFTQAQIALQLNISPRQVGYTLSYRLTPQKQKCGRKVLLNTPQRKRLIEWVCASEGNRRTRWTDILDILGWNCGEWAIRTAFKREGFVRRIARRKPPLTAEHKRDRLAWAWEHLFWTDEQWDLVLWTDETWVNPGKHKKAWVTRRIGEEELFHDDFLEKRYQRKIGWMFWGSISGKYGRHRGLFWEKDWETINAGSYSGHSAAFTKEVFEAIGIKPIFWPANSPDLNPIETLWDLIKDYIQKNYPEVHSSYPRLRTVVQEAWESITEATIKELIRSMGDRCIEVILADGGHTKY
ncbi:Homeo [Glarea lozoyensis ATCC 20868]|uniref:Homeo n=1 Tax=Glarea lozoyensis (strain ATCC 20868 / MF5171) TaxID=1116229 RepID=S3DCP0_GLAL2|nr:Homeo [Glarea lozoyensis ATCC 20868]EPE35500.1 Homeo [Glarea lozoyensis ATCC 20868]